MTQALIVTGNIQFPPTPDAQNATLPIGLQINFTQLHMDQLVYNAPAVSQPIVFGTMTNPKGIFIEVLSGSCVIKMAVGDGSSIPLGLSLTPLATDRSIFQLVNPLGLGAMTMVVTIAQSATIKVLAVQ